MPATIINIDSIAKDQQGNFELHFNLKAVGDQSTLLITRQAVRILWTHPNETLGLDRLLMVNIGSELITGSEQSLYEVLWVIGRSEVKFEIHQNAFPFLPSNNSQEIQQAIENILQSVRESAEEGMSMEEWREDIIDDATEIEWWFLDLQPTLRGPLNPRVKLTVSTSDDLNLWRTEGFKVLGGNDLYALVVKPGEAMLIRRAESEQHPNQLVIRVTAPMITGQELSLFEAIWVAHRCTAQSEFSPDADSMIPIPSENFDALFKFMIIFLRSYCKDMTLEEARGWMKKFENPLAKWIVDIDVV